MKYRTLHKWHVWLGWLVGVPLILWTLSGLFMVLIPIEEIRGEHLRAELPVLEAGLNPVPPAMEIRGVKTLTLESQPSGPVWVIAYNDGGMRRADIRTGGLLPPVGAAEARSLADGYYAGSEKITAVKKFAADIAPFDLRRERPSWQVSLSEGTQLYIDADSAQLLAIRTNRWRAFDFMWGIHIMDLQTREDTSHPILIGFAALSLIALLMAFAMQIWRQRRRRRTAA
jgi:hypothetical protein